MSMFENFTGLPIRQRYFCEYSSHFNTIIAKQKEECPSSSPSNCTSQTTLLTHSFRTIASIFFSFLYLHFFPQIVLLQKKINALIFMSLILQTYFLHSSSCKLLAVEELCAASSCYKQMDWKKWTIFFDDVATDNKYIYIYIHISVSECKHISLY